ncbi:phage tail protein [Streptomyces lavendulocolor]
MATLESMTVRLGIDTDQLRAGAERAKGILTGLGKAVGGLGVGAPVAAATATAVGGMAAAFASAGIAAKAFQLAAGPQMEAVTEASAAAEKAEAAHEKATLKTAAAQKLAAKGGEEYESALREAESASKAAKEADAAYEQQLAGLPPATREMSKALTGLKDDHQKWSDSLSSSTMPVFTKGINILRGLLPMLTPFVKAAANAFGGFLDKVAKGVQSARFKEWAADMSSAAGPALTNFLTVVKNLAVGFGSLLGAFAPASAGVTGGLVEMTGAFADWAGSLKGSEGFERFLNMAESGGDTLGTVAEAAWAVLKAVAPLLGVTTLLANAFGEIVASVPTPVLSTLIGVLAAVKVGMMLYAAGSAAVATANAVMASSTYLAIAGWTRMMAVALMAYARTAAAAVVSAATTALAWTGSALASIGTWIAAVLRAGAVAVAQFALMAARAIIWAATMAAQWLIAMGPIGWIIGIVIALAALIIANWDKIKKWTGQAWDWVWGKIQGIGRSILGFITNLPLVRFFIQHWDKIKLALALKLVQLIQLVRGLPARIREGLGNLGNLLYNAGRDVVMGLWNGIKSMGGWLKDTLIGWGKAMIPGPIAKALGIASPSRYMAKHIGRWIPAGIVQGIEAGQGEVDTTMRHLVNVPGMNKPRPTGGGTCDHRMLLEWVGNDALKRAIRVVVVDGGGNVQEVLGN